MTKNSLGKKIWVPLKVQVGQLQHPPILISFIDKGYALSCRPTAKAMNEAAKPWPRLKLAV